MTRRVLNVSQAIAEDNGTMTRVFQEWQTLVTLLIPFDGAGSPEGVVPARQFSNYYDTTAAAGSIHYIKMTDDVGGDKTLGWKLA